MKASLNHMHTAKTVISLMIVLVAFGIFGIFYAYQKTLLDDPNNLRSFMILVVIGSGFLAGLLFLVNKSEHKTVVHHSRTKAKKRKK